MSSITELLDELQIKILDMEDKLEDLDRATRRLRQERDEATSELRRSISADDLREGMQVAYCVPRGSWETCTVQRSADGTGEGFKDPMWGRRVFGIEDAIVLLEDAPEPEQPTTTVADLESAPVGSKLSAIPGYRTPYWTKRSDGLWEDISNEYALPSGAFQPTLGARTLTHPEPEPVTAEAIRESEPGSTFVGPDGAVWEWDGISLYIHYRSSSGMHPAITEPEDLARHGVTRSTVPARGDYSPKVPKVGDTITTVSELDALPERSVALDRDGDPCTKGLADGSWHRLGDDGIPASELAREESPLTVLHIPKGGA